MASYDIGKAEVCAWIRENFKTDASILDVGACDGKWRDLLPEYKHMDAVEAYAPNIEKYDLKSKYRKVFNIDIRDHSFVFYELIIFGDILEHLTTEQAQAVLKYAEPRCRNLIIGVPFLYEQGAIYGNPYEVHKQPDLTDEIFRERYPGFVPLYKDETYCFYIKEID